MAIAPVPPFPFPRRPFSSITPFTYSDAMTHLELLEKLRVYAGVTLPDEINKVLDEYSIEITAEVQAAIDLMIDTLNVKVGEVNDAIQQVINDSIEVQDPVVAGIVGDFESETASLLHSMFDPLDWDRVRIAGAGIDPTGVADSTAALNSLISAAPEGSRVVGNPNEVYRVSDSIVLDKKLTLENASFILDQSVSIGSAIEVMADGVTLEGVRAYSEGTPPTGTGTGRLYGIMVRADDVVINKCHIERFGNGIHLNFNSRVKNARITNNRIKDIQGSGEEDKGDGISVNGSHCIVTGNLINALAGTDARIGISVESLSTQDIPENIEHYRANTVVSGNVIYGKFRRGIALENVETTVVDSNTVADSTWTGIMVAMQCRNVVVSNNTIVWTRTANDNQGANWDPRRSPFHTRGPALGVTLTGNSVRMVSDSAANEVFGMVGNTLGGVWYYPSAVEFSHNLVRIEQGASVGAAVYSPGDVNRIRILDNLITGPVNGRGFHFTSGSDIEIVGNRVEGSNNVQGVNVVGATAPIRIADNQLTNFSTGIACGNGSLRRVIGNHVQNSSRGVDAFGLTDSVINSNLFKSCTTPIYNLGSSANVTEVGNAEIA